MAKRLPPRTWTVLEGLDYSGIPNGGGMYAVYIDSFLTYIGQSRDLRKRLCTHNIRYGYSKHIFTPWGTYVDVSIKIKMPKKYGEWAMTELKMIRRLQPPENCAGSVKRRLTNGKV